MFLNAQNGTVVREPQILVTVTEVPIVMAIDSSLAKSFEIGGGFHVQQRQKDSETRLWIRF